MLLEVLGKLFHAVVRKRLIAWADITKNPTQYGGFAGQQIAFASQHLRSYVHLVASRTFSNSVVFLDVRSAFHCLIREHAFGSESALPMALQALLRQEGIDVAALDANKDQHCEAFASSATPSLVRIVQDAHASTWFTTANTNNCFQTSRGSRPGSPLADVAYNILMREVLTELATKINSLEPILQVNDILQMQVPVLAWVDDVAIPVPTQHADQHIEVVQTVLNLALSVFQSYGLRLNFQPGKTEVVCQLRGNKAVALRRKVFVQDFATVPIEGGHQVRLVSMYKHLGMLYAQNLSLAHDIQARIGRASTQFRQISRTILLNRHVPTTTRLQLLDSLVLPMIFYGSGSWALLPASVFQKLHHFIVSLQRRIVGQGFWSDDRQTDRWFMADWKLPCLGLRLAKHRLLYALQIAKHAPQVLWDCICQEDLAMPDSDDTWLAALRHAIRWYTSLCPTHELAHSDLAPTAIHQWITSATAQEPAAIRNAVKRSVLQEWNICQVFKGHQAIHKHCLAVAAPMDFAPQDIPDVETTHKCPDCGKSFPTPQGLNTHRWTAHQSISLGRKYVRSGTCDACGKHFWTAQRVQQHLRYSRKFEYGCLAWLVDHIEPLDAPIEVTVPPELAHLHRLPWVQTAGPQPHIRPLWIRETERAFQQWQQEWTQEGYPLEVPSAFVDEIWNLIEADTTLWINHFLGNHDKLVHYWLQKLDTFFQEDISTGYAAVWAFLSWGATRMYDFLFDFEDSEVGLAVDECFLSIADTWPMWQLMNRLDKLRRIQQPDRPCLSLAVPAQDTRIWKAREPIFHSQLDQATLLKPFIPTSMGFWKAKPGVPLLVAPDGTKFLLVLHLFSGRRRQGDWHEWIAKLVPSMFPDLKAMVLSLDTAVDAALGNLAPGPNVDTILRIVDAGLVALSLSGPPCETWTAARYLRTEETSRRLPRPLRDASLPWGLPGLTTGELYQVATGSQLMLSNLRIEVGVFTAGGGAGMEHPAAPHNEAYASIWRTPIHTQVVMATDNSQVVRLEQWRYETSSVKPTNMRFIGLPPLAAHLHRQAGDYERPSTVLSGHNWDGSFKTAEAKEYPAPLCEAFARSMLRGLKMRSAREGFRPLPSSLLGERDWTWLLSTAHSSSKLMYSSFLPDYQPNAA